MSSLAWRRAPIGDPTLLKPIGSVASVELEHQRAQIRQLRREPRGDSADAARYERLEAAGFFDAVSTVAAYVADDGEADPLPWRHVAAGRRVALPTVGDDELMTFSIASSPSDLVIGRWGIATPGPDAESVDLAAVDLVCVPLVVFDARCARAGRGRGYYDVALRPLRDLADRPCLIGVAEGFQRVAEVPQHSGDVRLDVVATATSLYRRSSMR